MGRVTHFLSVFAFITMWLGASSAAAQAGPASGLSDGYRINAGDEIEIYVWGDPRLQRSVKVLPDGSVAFPLAGQVTARGLLPSELEAVLSERLAEQYRGEVPQITVSVIAATGMQVSVMGKVNAPGTFTPGRYINILEALSMAGGPSQFADLNDVVVIRKTDNGLTTIPVDVERFFGKIRGAGMISPGLVPRLEPGDTIIVP